jgi:hypothetical protein
MSALNLDPLLTFTDGSHLVVSTRWVKEGDFLCALFHVKASATDGTSFQIVSNYLSGTACLNAQNDAYSRALRLYPEAGAEMKKPPYLIWPGPLSMNL